MNTKTQTDYIIELEEEIAQANEIIVRQVEIIAQRDAHISRLREDLYRRTKADAVLGDPRGMKETTLVSDT